MDSTKELNIKIRTRGRRFTHDAKQQCESRLLTGLVRTSHGLVLNFAKKCPIRISFERKEQRE